MPETGGEADQGGLGSRHRAVPDTGWAKKLAPRLEPRLPSLACGKTFPVGLAPAETRSVIRSLPFQLVTNQTVPAPKGRDMVARGWSEQEGAPTGHDNRSEFPANEFDCHAPLVPAVGLANATGDAPVPRFPQTIPPCGIWPVGRQTTDGGPASQEHRLEIRLQTASVHALHHHSTPTFRTDQESRPVRAWR